MTRTIAVMTVIECRANRPGDRADQAYAYEDRFGERALVLRNYDLAHEFLRVSEGVVQAGFGAEKLMRIQFVSLPMLFLEGAEHRERRRHAARFFAPRTVTTKYTQRLEAIADEIVAAFEADGAGQLDQMAFRMAMRVVSEIVGLTESDQNAMERLLDKFFLPPPPPGAVGWRKRARELQDQLFSLQFYIKHVRPALKARAAAPRDDIISSFIERRVRAADAAVECLTYAAAGMVTTRQFIVMAAWHLIDRPALLTRYLAADRVERLTILNEILRLDSVASDLLRRTQTDISLDSGRLVIPKGTLVVVGIRGANSNPDIFGADALVLNPDRCPRGGVPASGLAFGGGRHSCPGESLALAETDVFLRRLFRGGVRLVTAPTVSWNDVVHAYHLSDCRIEQATAPS